jgi:hypothetical protein
MESEILRGTEWEVGSRLLFIVRVLYGLFLLNYYSQIHFWPSLHSSLTAPPYLGFSLPCSMRRGVPYSSREFSSWVACTCGSSLPNGQPFMIFPEVDLFWPLLGKSYLLSSYWGWYFKLSVIREVITFQQPLSSLILRCQAQEGLGKQPWCGLCPLLTCQVLEGLLVTRGFLISLLGWWGSRTQDLLFQISVSWSVQVAVTSTWGRVTDK